LLDENIGIDKLEILADGFENSRKWSYLRPAKPITILKNKLSTMVFLSCCV
jgi:hypothetical protein